MITLKWCKDTLNNVSKVTLLQAIEVYCEAAFSVTRFIGV